MGNAVSLKMRGKSVIFIMPVKSWRGREGGAEGRGGEGEGERRRGEEGGERREEKGRGRREEEGKGGRERKRGENMKCKLPLFCS